MEKRMRAVSPIRSDYLCKLARSDTVSTMDHVNLIRSQAVRTMSLHSTDLLSLDVQGDELETLDWNQFAENESRRRYDHFSTISGAFSR